MSGTRYSGTYPDEYGGSYPADYCSVTFPLISFTTASVESWSVNETFGAADTTQLIRVRRSGDNAESDFGTTNGYLDAAAMVDWVTQSGADPTANGFTVTAYGHRGLYNLTQATAAAQPKIVNAGSLVTTSGGAAAMSFDGTDDELLRSDACGISGSAAFMMLCFGSNTTINRCFCSIGANVALQRASLFPFSSTTLTGALFSSANRIFNSSNWNGEYAYAMYLAASAQIGTTVMRQNGSALTESSSVSPTSTLNISNTATCWGSVNSTSFLAGKSTSFVLFNDITNAAADAALYEAYCVANY